MDRGIGRWWALREFYVSLALFRRLPGPASLFRKVAAPLWTGADPGQLQDVTRSTMARVAGGDMVTGIAEIIECEVPRL